MASATKRNIPLDVLRGLSILIMILVDATPDFNEFYPILTHSPWEGITIADLAFPGFVFAMGASGGLSILRRRKEGKGGWVRKILRRSLLLFLLGVLLNLLPDIFSRLLANGYDNDLLYENAFLHGRVFGVLQRLALTYLLGMFILLALRGKASIGLAAVALLGLSSAGFHLYSPEAPFDKLQNISRAVDLLFPGEGHIYPFATAPHDPEGLYGTLASTSSMLFGALAGRILGDRKSEKGRAALLFLVSLALLSLGGLWSFVDMVGKPLWTAPYALLNGGVDMLALTGISAFLYRAPGVDGLLRLFCAFGRNPLFFYLATNIALILLWKLPSPLEGLPMYPWLWQSTLRGFVSPPFSATLYALLWCVLWYPVAEFLYRKGIVLKL